MKFLMVGGCLLVAAVFGGLIRRNHERRNRLVVDLKREHYASGVEDARRRAAFALAGKRREIA